MKTTLLSTVLILMLFTCGCATLDRLKSDQSENTNFNSSPAVPSAATLAPSPAATPDASPAPFERAALGRNRLAFGSGAIITDKTSESSPDPARSLIDEAGFGWASAAGQITSQSVTLELPARTILKTIVFDTHQPTYYDGRGAKDVTVEVSDESATSGFQTVLETTLKDSSNKNGLDDQLFPVEKEIAGRFVRYTAKNNYGSPAAIFTKELSGYGDQEGRASVGNVSGTYDFEGIVGQVHLKQEGSSIIGCYDENEGLLAGTIDGRVLTLVADEKAERVKGEKTRFVAANVIEGDQTILSAWWGWSATPQEKNYDRLHIGHKKGDQVGNCKHLPDLDGSTKDVAKESLEKELADKGKAILYGINFDFNSDVIKPESKPILEKVVAILKEKSDWKFSVEGHTDNVGGESFNQTLSEKRAAAVVKYLTGAGVDANRLTATGYGLSRPVAPNNSETERAQNRRVELIKR